MPRSIQADPYQANRFHVIDSEGKLNSIGSFFTCSLPEITTNVVEYKGGTSRKKKKMLGDPEYSDVDLTKGVFKKDTALYKWMMDGIKGREYRTDVEILEFHQSDVENLDNFANAQPTRKIKLLNAMATRMKPGSDKDAQSDEVSIEEVTISIEDFDVEDLS